MGVRARGQVEFYSPLDLWQVVKLEIRPSLDTSSKLQGGVGGGVKGTTR